MSQNENGLKSELLETNPEFMQIAAPADTVVLIAFEVSSANFSGLINVCYPYFTLEPIMAYLNVATWASRERGAPSASPCVSAIGRRRHP